MKFVAQNSRGFANSWQVLAFKTKREALDYVDNTQIDCLSSQYQPRLIPKADVGYWYGERPKPFSGQCYIIVQEENAPCYGYVTIGHPDNGERVF